MKTWQPKSACGVVVGAFAALVLTFGIQIAVAAETAKAATKSESGFSFVAHGDSRPMMYLPIKDGQPEVSKLFVEMFGLVMPEKVAEEVVKRDVKMIFDPVTKELIKVIMPFESRSE